MANRVNDEIEYPFNINYIMKYKKGEAYYFLTKLYKGATTYDELTFKPFPPNIQMEFNHALTGEVYTYALGNKEKFTDRFEMVYWKNLPQDLQIKIADANRGRYLDVKCRTISHRHIEHDINSNINEMRYGFPTADSLTTTTNIDNSTGISITNSDTIEIVKNTGILIYNNNAQQLVFDDTNDAIIIEKRRTKRKIISFYDIEPKIIK